MDQFKLDIFAKNHPGVVPPHLDSLSAAATASIRDVLAHRLGLRSGGSPELIVRRLDEAESVMGGVDAMRPDFTLGNAARTASINPSGSVLLNWYRFDRIDQIRWADLEAFFGDIWYPSSDDIDIFDSSCEWVLSVVHNGTVKTVRFPSSPS